MKAIKIIPLIILLTTTLAICQSIDIGTGAELEMGAGTDICATAFGNITGNITGTGTNCTQAMPVEMMVFTSLVNKDNVTLNWQTASEENNRGFEIYRSIKDSKTEWYKISFINGNGTKHTPTNYTYTDSKIKSGKYYYRLKQLDNNGNMQYYELNNFVEIKPPGKFELSQNYPNPFNPTTKISFTLSNDTKVSLKVYDISGREVSSILNNKTLTADYYTVEFSASNLASGIYFYRIVTNESSIVKKMAVIK
ncbi:MAG: T9SS type A sorting domain-containing protein [Ignavibacteriae bacterium]|nr:T9SS type A sorting domain-containing protein [Ignavibacteriota bacterium]